MLHNLYADDAILYASSSSLNTALTSNTMEYAFTTFTFSQTKQNTSIEIYHKPSALSKSPLWIVQKSNLLNILVSGMTAPPPLTYINTLLSKVKTWIGFVYHHKSSFTNSAKNLLVKISIIPILDYSDVMYRTASESTHLSII